MVKNLSLLTLMTLLSGCIAFTPMTGAFIALDVGSYVGTNKGLSDHVVSSMTGKDCASYRLLSEGQVCRDTSKPAKPPVVKKRDPILEYNCRLYSWDKDYFNNHCK